MAAEPLVATIEIRVRYAETDQMGIAHHSNYPRWFEVGRIELLARAGLSYRELEARGLFLPVLELGIKYLQPCRFDDLLALETRLLELTPSRLSFGNLLRHPASGQLVARAYSTHGQTDGSGLAGPLSPELVDALAGRVHPESVFGRKRRAFRF